MMAIPLPHKFHDKDFPIFFQTLQRIWVYLEAFYQHLKSCDSSSSVYNQVRDVIHQLDPFKPESWQGMPSQAPVPWASETLALTFKDQDEEDAVLKGLSPETNPSFILWPVHQWWLQTNEPVTAYLGAHGLEDMDMTYFSPHTQELEQTSQESQPMPVPGLQDSNQQKQDQSDEPDQAGLDTEPFAVLGLEESAGDEEAGVEPAETPQSEEPFLEDSPESQPMPVPGLEDSNQQKQDQSDEPDQAGLDTEPFAVLGLEEPVGDGMEEVESPETFQPEEPFLEEQPNNQESAEPVPMAETEASSSLVEVEHPEESDPLPPRESRPEDQENASTPTVLGLEEKDHHQAEEVKAKEADESQVPPQEDNLQPMVVPGLEDLHQPVQEELSEPEHVMEDQGLDQEPIEEKKSDINRHETPSQDSEP